MFEQDKRIIKKYYNNLAKKHWSKVPQRYDKGIITTFYNLREKSIVKRLVTVTNNSLTLDLCSGPGRWILEYVERGAQVIALDISPEILRSSKKKTESLNYLKEKVNFIIADAENIPFINNIFNIVNCFDAFPHFPNQEKALIEMKRITNTNSIIIFEPSNIHSIMGMGIYIIRFICSYLIKINIKLPIWTTNWNTYNNISQIKNLIKLIGLEIIYMKGVLVVPPFSHFTLKLYYKIEEKLEKYTWFNFLGSRIVFICMHAFKEGI